MSKFTVQEENTYDVLLELYELGEAHYYEVEEKSSEVPFDLDIKLLYEYVKLDLLYIITARDVLGNLIAYFANMISPDPFTSKPVGKELAIYVDPSWRKSSVFSEMLKLVEEGGKARKAHSQLLIFKEGHDVGIAQKNGYGPTERVYQKVYEV